MRIFLILFSSMGALLWGVLPTHAAALHPAPLRVVQSNVQVSHDTYLAHSEPAIAENPRDRNNLIAGSKFFTDPAHYKFKIGTFYTTDGGQSWHDSGLLSGFANYELVSDISLTFDAHGTAYACVLAVKGNKSGIFVSRSTDGGRTFSAPVTVFLDATGATFSDKPWIAIDRTTGATAGNIYVAWNLDGNSAGEGDPDLSHMAVANPKATPAPDKGVQGIVLARSTDGGKSFSAPVMLAPFSSQTFYLGAIPQVGPQGQVYVAFASINNDQGLVSGFTLVTSTDGGQTFTTPQTIQNNVQGLHNRLPNGTFRNFSLPTFAVSPRDGALMIAWADMRNGDADILESHSIDGGITWSAAYRVNHDHLHNGKDQFQPALAVARDGTFTCAWFDRRHDPNNRLIDEELAQSTDDGASFGHNFRVTQHSWDPAVGAPVDENKNTFIGDYQALAVDNRTVHPLWNDTQNGKSQQIVTAVIAQRLLTAH